MLTPTVTLSGNVIRPFNESDQDSPDQGSQRLVLTQPKEFYAAGFQGLVKRWDRCLNVQGHYVEK
jgi:hypothetical protein